MEEDAQTACVTQPFVVARPNLVQAGIRIRLGVAPSRNGFVLWNKFADCAGVKNSIPGVVMPAGSVNGE